MKKSIAFIIAVIVACAYFFTQGVAYAQGAPIFRFYWQLPQSERRVISPIPSTSTSPTPIPTRIPTLIPKPTIVTPTVITPSATPKVTQPEKMNLPSPEPTAAEQNTISNTIPPSPTVTPKPAAGGSTQKKNQNPPGKSGFSIQTIPAVQNIADQAYRTFSYNPLSLLNRAIPGNYYMNKSLTKNETIALLTTAAFCVGIGLFLLKGGVKNTLMKKL